MLLWVFFPPCPATTLGHWNINVWSAGFHTSRWTDNDVPCTRGLTGLSLYPCVFPCSSSLRHPGKVHIVFSVVRFPACAEHPERTGLCTGWLADCASTIVEPYGTPCGASRESVDHSALPKVRARAHLDTLVGCEAVMSPCMGEHRSSRMMR